jgi:hypothetical protein
MEDKMKHLRRTGIIFLMIMVGLSATVLAQGKPSRNINSQKPIYLIDPITRQSFDKLEGCVIVAWQEATPYAFVNAKVFTGTDSYEFILVKVKSSDKDMIEGSYNIYKNGSPVGKEVAGKTYGWNLTTGKEPYFKFYAGKGQVYAEEWHFSFYLEYSFNCGKTNP